jgi:hypothetical protein
MIVARNSSGAENLVAGAPQALTLTKILRSRKPHWGC